jgi:hypothetical protein
VDKNVIATATLIMNPSDSKKDDDCIPVPPALNTVKRFSSAAAPNRYTICQQGAKEAVQKVEDLPTGPKLRKSEIWDRR